MDVASWKHWRVMFQYFNPTDPGPFFEFTTVLAPTAEAAASDLFSVRSRDRNLTIVQVVEANEFSTGYTYADVKAQRTDDEIRYEERRDAVLKEFHESEGRREE